jgi:hypothetical protein
MTAGGTDEARRRAELAGARARKIRSHLEAVEAGREKLHGASVEEVADAQLRAVEARERLRLALESSAAAHDRAAAGHEALAGRSAEPDGPPASQAADHRRYAQHDRNLAADLPSEPEPQPPS